MLALEGNPIGLSSQCIGEAKCVYNKRLRQDLRVAEHLLNDRHTDLASH